MFFLRKRGLSGVITTLILILLTLVAVGVIWAVIVNVINDGVEIEQQSRFGPMTVTSGDNIYVGELRAGIQ